MDPRGGNKFEPAKHPVPGKDSPHAGDHDKQDRERKAEAEKKRKK